MSQKCSLPFTAGCFLAWLCSISSTLFCTPGFIFFFSFWKHFYFLCIFVFTCCMHVFPSAQYWKPALALLKANTSAMAAVVVQLCMEERWEDIFSLNFIQANLSSVHTDYSNKVWLSYHFHCFDFLTGMEQRIPFFFLCVQGLFTKHDEELPVFCKLVTICRSNAHVGCNSAVHMTAKERRKSLTALASSHWSVSWRKIMYRKVLRGWNSTC